MHTRSSKLLHLSSVTLICISLLTAIAKAECYGTPQAAVDAVVSAHSSRSGTEGIGYRVIKIQSDPLLSRSWAVVARCDHPAWSMLFVPASAALPILSKAEQASPDLSFVVHAGDRVRLWRREAWLQIQTVAVCEQNGKLGERIRVRLQRRNDTELAPEQVMAIVQDQSDVEITP